jgi:DNA-binding IclR family transcriptional regulator
MVRPALAAARAVEVIDFFAAHPGEPFTLSELSRRLGINMASALSVLRALEDGGYLVRHPVHKTYTMGPSLIAAGHAALSEHPVVDLARQEMARLSEEVRTECVASVVVGEDIVIVATEGRPRLEAADVRVGQRLPLVPPIGQVFLAWSPESHIEAWLSRLGRHGGNGWTAHLRRSLGTVRRRGYSVTREVAGRARLGKALEQLADSPDALAEEHLAERVTELGEEYELLDIEASRSYEVAIVAAPVFGPTGEVALALTLNGLGTVEGARLSGYAERLVSSTRLLTKKSHGRQP